jgi:hypothetical protein
VPKLDPLWFAWRFSFANASGFIWNVICEYFLKTLTTGLTAAGVDSLYAGQTRIETPHLAIKYEAPPQPTFWRT